MMILSQYHIFELDTINIYSVHLVDIWVNCGSRHRGPRYCSVYCKYRLSR
jgi:hypothetical protein